MLVGLLMLLTGIIYLFIYLQSNLSLIYKWPILQDRVYYFALNVFNTTAGNKEANKILKGWQILVPLLIINLIVELSFRSYISKVLFEASFNYQLKSKMTNVCSAAGMEIVTS